VGVISTSGGEIGPFVAVEQGALTDALIRQYGEEEGKLKVPVCLGYYNAIGYFAQAAGALTAGTVVSTLETRGWTDVASMRVIFCWYGGIGILMAVC